ncbi:hypothetical protein PPERSA_05983 [Pseudocohnilembus persalinus]|uniref:RyR/IP3R Homology associated domain-containing protein n=1 Tax=Pseudocohnilembus persalinus TaxID=266149 RepID=A0A0V0R4A7_PSEPJ|nr:hypothetical protein PPERSA_05983 [Pseudocohnilembus persalinus]|eukprot:KRX09314.1 hypothetical protein PPERSA_05983 [Pseudocohnilembus persalinus]
MQEQEIDDNDNEIEDDAQNFNSAQNLSPFTLAKECEDGHSDFQKQTVLEKEYTLNCDLKNTNYNINIPDQEIIDINLQQKINKFSFDKIIYEFIINLFHNKNVNSEIILKLLRINTGVYNSIKYQLCVTVHDIIIEVLKNDMLVQHLKNVSLDFMNILLDNFGEIQNVLQVDDLSYKKIRVLNLLMNSLNSEDKYFLRERENQLKKEKQDVKTLQYKVRKMATLFFSCKKLQKEEFIVDGCVEEFTGQQLFEKQFNEILNYDHSPQLIKQLKKQYQNQNSEYSKTLFGFYESEDIFIKNALLLLNYQQNTDIYPLVYNLELFEALSSIIMLLPTELLGVVYNNTENLNQKLQEKLVLYLFSWQNPVLIRQKSISFFLNIYFYSQEINEDNPAYQQLMIEKNLKLAEQTMTYTVLPFYAAVINEEFIYKFFGDYLRSQNINEAYYQKVLKSIGEVFIKNQKIREILQDQIQFDDRKDKLEQFSLNFNAKIKNTQQKSYGAVVLDKGQKYLEQQQQLTPNEQKIQESQDIQGLIPQILKKIDQIIQKSCSFAFSLPFISKNNNKDQFQKFFNSLLQNQFIDKQNLKNPYMKSYQISAVQDALFVVQSKSSGTLDAMKYQLREKQQILSSNVENNQEKEINNQIMVQLKDDSINEEFFFFLSPFEDLLMYLVYNDEKYMDFSQKNVKIINNALEKNLEKKSMSWLTKGKQKSEYQNINEQQQKMEEEKEENTSVYKNKIIFDKRFEKFIRKKYKFISQDQKQEKDLEKLLGEEYIQIFALNDNVISIFKNIFAYIQASLQKLNDKQIQDLSNQYMQVIQAIMFKYGATSQKLDYFDFKNGSKTQNEKNSNILEDLQNFIIDQYNMPDMVSNTFSQAFLILSGKKVMNRDQEENFISHLIQMVKMGNVLLSNYNESAQKAFMQAFKLENDSQLMQKQTIVFGIQKILRFCSAKIQANDVYASQMAVLAESLLKFIQDLCDAHNVEAQNFLREQPGLLKTVNLVYEISILMDTLIEEMKIRFFKYKYMSKKEKKIFKQLFGKQNRDMQSYPKKKTRKFLNYSQISQQEITFIAPLIQCFKTISELLNGNNVKNMIIIINTLAPERINQLLQFLNAFFFKFDFNLPEYKNSIKKISYYGCFVQSQEYLDCIYDSNPQNALQNKIFNNNKYLKKNEKNSQQNQIVDTCNSEDVKESITRNDSSGNIATQQNLIKDAIQTCNISANQSQNLTEEQQKIKLTNSKVSMVNQVEHFTHQVYHDIVQVPKSNLFKLYISRDIDYNPLMRKQQFVQILLEMEKSILDFLIFAYQFRTYVEASNSVELGLYNSYLQKFDYALLLENLKSRFYPTAQSTYIQKVIHQYYYLFLGNLNEEISPYIEEVNEKFQIWEAQDPKRYHKNFIGSIEVINEQQNIQRIFFKIPRSVIRVWDIDIVSRQRNKMLEQISRDNPEDKIKNLLDKFEELEKTIEYQNILYKKFGLFLSKEMQKIVFYYLKNSNKYLLFAYIIISMIQNILQIIYTSDNDSDFYYENEKWGVRIPFYIFGIANQLGFWYQSSFYAYGLLMILYGIDFTKEIIFAVLNHIDQLAISIILSMIILYWFTIIAFNTPWKGEYGFDDQMDCDTLWKCIRVHFDYGYLTPPVWNDVPLPAGGSVWNFFFNLLVGMILTAIISGIIIDSFGERREKKKIIKEDNMNRCFICNIDREEFERQGEDFNYHQSEEHNKYNYLYYTIAVKKMSKSQRSNIDDYIYENASQHKIEHIPIKRCLMLKQFSNIEDADIPMMQKSMDMQFMNFNKKLQQIENTLIQIQKNQNI